MQSRASMELLDWIISGIWGKWLTTDLLDPELSSLESSCIFISNRLGPEFIIRFSAPLYILFLDVSKTMDYNFYFNLLI